MDQESRFWWSKIYGDGVQQWTILTLARKKTPPTNKMVKKKTIDGIENGIGILGLILFFGGLSMFIFVANSNPFSFETNLIVGGLSVMSFFVGILFIGAWGSN